MAKNGIKGDNHRQGEIKNRAQAYNPKNGLFVKIDTKNGRFIDVKTTKGKFKGVREV